MSIFTQPTISIRNFVANTRDMARTYHAHDLCSSWKKECQGFIRNFQGVRNRRSCFHDRRWLPDIWSRSTNTFCAQYSNKYISTIYKCHPTSRKLIRLGVESMKITNGDLLITCSSIVLSPYPPLVVPGERKIPETWWLIPSTTR